jgi:hypothetical protein
MAVYPEQFRDCLRMGFALVLPAVVGTAVKRKGENDHFRLKAIPAIEAKAAAQFRIVLAHGFHKRSGDSATSGGVLQRTQSGLDQPH